MNAASCILGLAPLAIFTSCERAEDKIDREAGWHEVKTYSTTTSGIELAAVLA
jgi:hypothetical protein